MPKSYSEKLKDPRWQRKRLEVLQRDNFTCRFCCGYPGKESETIHVHHRWYENGKDPWDYPNECFVSLCEPCHKLIEERLRFIKEIGRYFDEHAIWNIVEFLMWAKRTFPCQGDFQEWLGWQYRLIYGAEKSTSIVALEMELLSQSHKLIVDAKRRLEEENANTKY